MAYLGLPVALDLGSRTGAPVVYDARDIYLEARNLARMPRPARALFAWLERRWARRASRVVTVNDAYADELAGRLGVERPLVVMNCPSRDEAPRIRARRFHQRLGLPDSARVVLYHGGLTEERGIEELVAALPSLHPAAHLVLMGYGPLRDTLVERAGEPATGGRLHVLPAVPPAELLDWVAAADVAAMPIQPTTLNHRLTTPNKLFEAMAAGVPIVAADLPGMAAIVTATGCGVVCDPTNVADLARAINALLDLDAATLEGYRRRALAAVADRYHWEHQAETLLAAYTRLTGRPW
jgi:glycosyltransferase involved in cell wall biosynthesis